MIKHYAAHTVEASIFGEGAPGLATVWLFHSLLADAGSCLPLAHALALHHRVAVPSLPGFGGSTRAAAGPHLEAVADRLAEAMREDAHPAAIVGNGYGSFVALTLALRHPDLAGRLVLAGTGATFSEPGRAAFRGMAAAAAAKGLAAIADTAMCRLFAPEFQEANPALLAERRAAFLATDPALFTEACAALATLDLRDAVTGLETPTLVMAGSLDEATPPAMAQDLAARLPHARYVPLEGLAHVPQLQDTDAFLAEAGPFLRGS